MTLASKIEGRTNEFGPGKKYQSCNPFLKWAGGKRWLLQRYGYLFPSNFNVYIEPFLGSAAAFFFLRPKYAVLADVNHALISTYITLRDHPEEVYEQLKHHQSVHSKEHYYKTRSSISDSNIDRAADFIYLNRSCWNGLYRVNKFGQFNVPIGTKTSIVFPNDDFCGTSKRLISADIKIGDFEAFINDAGHRDFVFVDPPYTIRHDNNGFVKYNEHIFRWSDQCRLRHALERASSRGAFIMVTNANHHSVRELYSDFGNIIEVHRNSVISGSSKGRVKATELVIRNYI